MEESGCGWVYGTGKEHKTFCEDVCSETQHGVSVDTGMFKVDPRCSVCGYDDLELLEDKCLGRMSEYLTSTHFIIPTVCTCSNLYTSLQFVSSTQEIIAEFGQVVRVGVVQANDEKSVVYNFQTRLVIPISCERFAEGGPILPVFG